MPGKIFEPRCSIFCQHMDLPKKLVRRGHIVKFQATKSVGWSVPCAYHPFLACSVCPYFGCKSQTDTSCQPLWLDYSITTQLPKRRSSGLEGLTKPTYSPMAQKVKLRACDTLLGVTTVNRYDSPIALLGRYPWKHEYCIVISMEWRSPFHFLTKKVRIYLDKYIKEKYKNRWLSYLY